MELVIKIDEEQYRLIMASHRTRVAKYVDKEGMIYAIKNGIPLPKGHGRIADMDEAIKCIEEVNGEDAVWAIGLINWACDKRTVLGADEEEK